MLLKIGYYMEGIGVGAFLTPESGTAEKKLKIVWRFKTKLKANSEDRISELSCTFFLCMCNWLHTVLQNWGFSSPAAVIKVILKLVLTVLFTLPTAAQAAQGSALQSTKEWKSRVEDKEPISLNSSM